MIVCTRCGTENVDEEQFCVGCQGYLPHIGERVVEEVEEELPEETEEPAADAEVDVAVADETPEAPPWAVVADDTGAAQVPTGVAAEQTDAARDTLVTTPAEPVTTGDEPVAEESVEEPPAEQLEVAEAAGTVAEGEPAMRAEAAEPPAPLGEEELLEAGAPPSPETPEPAAVGEEPEPARAAALVAKPPPLPSARRAMPARRRSSAVRMEGGGPGATSSLAGTEAVADQPAARQPEARQPAPPKPRRKPGRKQPPTRKAQPGDVICGQCGEPNSPDRKFCSRCASSLVEAKVAKVRWWQRIGRRGKTVAAGERPGRRGKKDVSRFKRAKRGVSRAGRTVVRWARVIIVLLVLLAGIGLIGPWREPATERVNEWYNAARRVVAPRYVAVNPIDAEASSALPGQPAALAIDGFHNTYWSAAEEVTPEGPVLVVTFPEPVDVARLGFLSGASGEEFLAQPRPRGLHIVFDSGTSESVVLDDSAEFQTFNVDGAGATAVEIRIESVYPSREGTNVSLTEVEFFRKQ